MNRIERLLTELCPEGVEFRALGDICNLSRGRVISKDYLRDHSGSYPVFSSQTENNGIFGRINTYDYFGTYITWTTDGAHAGSVFYRENERFSITNVCGILSLKNEEYINLKFIYYVLGIEAKKYVLAGMGNPKLMSNIMATIKIPIPPLAIQNEIVKILDKFVELQAELQARKIQYEYFRNKLSTFPSSESEAVYPWLHKQLNQYCPDGVIFKALEDVFDLRNGYTPSKNNPAFWEGGTIPWFRMEDIRTNGNVLDVSIQCVTETAIKGGQLFPANSILVATSATIGEHALITVPHLANQRFTCLSVKAEFNDVFNAKFIFYNCFVLNQWCCENTNSSSFASVDMQGFRQFKIPIIPIIIQQKIVDMLDKFYALSNDLMTEGLPAEIKRRKIQYEYYRNQLLTFKEKSTTLSATTN